MGRRKYKKGDDSAGRPLQTAEPNETIYGVVQQSLGNGRFLVLCSDTIVRNCQVRGAIYKKIWIQHDDYVLISFIIGEPLKGQIVLRYFDHEVKELKKKGLIPNKFADVGDEKAVGVDFDDGQFL
ncbi:Eukaryotic translation initiation factor 1A [Cucumispora dikerogammari]|nr:Eukaryotic translation initiation factor 1A [Cucumispora dikerogammari]